MRPARGPIIVSTFVGASLLFGGLVLAWLAFATPVLRSLAPTVVRPSIDQMAIGAAVWTVSLVAPPCFAIVGALRLGIVAASILRKPRLTPAARSLSDLPDEYLVAPSIILPDGRTVHNVVVGPFGLAILSEPPSPSATRRHGSAWEFRRRDGRWVPLENPLERASRDADRVRRWITSDERDFLVKVHVALVTSDPSITRSATCAVVKAGEARAWLASLPPQRSLNTTRRDDLAERVRAIA